MMRIKITTAVKGNYKAVFAQFDRDLFLVLKPPLLPMRLLRFDGSKTGDEVHISLGMGVLWKSKITQDNITEKQALFVDEAFVLPFFLSSWQHHHYVLKKDDQTSIIVDDIQYRSPFKLLDYLLYPAMYLQFWYRKPIYRKYFGKLFHIK